MSAKKIDTNPPEAVLPPENRPFEERLARLEAISEDLRRGQLGLESATGLFEEGIILARGLEKDLSRIERRVEILVNAPDAAGDTPVLELFPELGE